MDNHSADTENIFSRFTSTSFEMCSTFEETRKFFIIELKARHVHAYGLEKRNKQLWGLDEFKPDGMEYPMKPSGITTDGNGHLFICDEDNGCIQIFYTDGTYMYALWIVMVKWSSELQNVLPGVKLSRLWL